MIKIVNNFHISDLQLTYISSISFVSQESGLSRWIGNQLTPLHSIPPWAIVIILCLVIAVFTECTSNVATATLFLPVLATMVRIECNTGAKLKALGRFTHTDQGIGAGKSLKVCVHVHVHVYLYLYVPKRHRCSNS